MRFPNHEIGVAFPQKVEGNLRGRLATDPQTVDLRGHPRISVSWPVTVESGRRVFRAHTVNLSRAGVKVQLAEALEVGNLAKLHLHPPEGSSLDLDTIVWRADEDGPVFFFIGVHRDRN